MRIDILSSTAANESMFKFLLEHDTNIRVDKDGDSFEGQLSAIIQWCLRWCWIDE